jgi:hypothetical protein
VKIFVFVLFRWMPRGGGKLNELSVEESEVFVGEEGAGVVNKRGGGRAGAKTVIAKIAGCTTSICMFLEGGVEGFKELEEDKASKGNRERIALAETFFLGKIVDGAVGPGEVAVVGGGVHQVKVREDRLEGRFTLEGFTGGVTG